VLVSVIHGKYWLAMLYRVEYPVLALFFCAVWPTDTPMKHAMKRTNNDNQAVATKISTRFGLKRL
jgi:hypothetical protein